MDDNRGNFREIDDKKFNKQMELDKPQVFKVGETIEIRGSRLRVQKIHKNKITLKLLPQK